MKMQALLYAVWGIGLLLALNGTRVESARHKWQAPKTMFVFGDSFADTGNLPRTPILDEPSRSWFYPYGMSYLNATGRFSDFMVQSDFIANMLGIPGPPAFERVGPTYCHPSGVNFAYGDTGIYRYDQELRIFTEQVDLIKRMIDSGTISHNKVTHSIVLVAFSGHDYMQDFHNTDAFIGSVTTEIAYNVERLLDLGVKRVLVNNLHPLGCTPWKTRPNNYDVCDSGANKDASKHNANLEQKLGAKKGVLIVDMHTAFNNIIGHIQHGHAPYGQFKLRRKPCCISNDPTGYCGQLDERNNPLYTLCPDPTKHFFWDDKNPTHAGWEAVMKQLEEPIKEFIGL